MSYCIYLRKSRKDLEAEAHGLGETLTRHEGILNSLAAGRHLHIEKTYREIVSGESIASRPVMQHLLAEVESGLWEGVLVMEIERLARGDTIDQGIVQRAFQYSRTKIITPAKSYDPSDEFDREYFEFGLFMSRREYQTIKRRMQTGKYAAVREGKWPFNTAPYGFRREKLPGGKGWTLSLHDQEANAVRLIFSLYTGKEKTGISSICRILDCLNLPPRRSKTWSENSIRDILSNPVYDQKVSIGKRKVQTRITDGVPEKIRPRTQDYLVAQGRHPRMIPHTVFVKAQSLLASRSQKPAQNREMHNPLSGLIICCACKKKMQRRPVSNPEKNSGACCDLLICSTKNCPTVGSPLELVERQLVGALEEWLSSYRIIPGIDKDERREAAADLLRSSRAEYDKLLAQEDSVYRFLEQGIYSKEIFQKRLEALQIRISEVSARIKVLTDLTEKNREDISGFAGKECGILSFYREMSVRDKNCLLKLILNRAEYRKESKNRYGEGWVPAFELKLYPRLPKEKIL